MRSFLASKNTNLKLEIETPWETAREFKSALHRVESDAEKRHIL